MVEFIFAILTPLLITWLTPKIVGASADKIARSRSKERKQRALERVEGNPMCEPEAQINQLWMDTGGGLDQLPGEWRISEIRSGYLSIEQIDGRGKMNFTLEEWEGFHPIYDSQETVKFKPAKASTSKPVKPQIQAKQLRSKEEQNRAIPK